MKLRVRFEDPQFLLLLVLIPLVWMTGTRRYRAAFRFPFARRIKEQSRTSQAVLAYMPQLLRTLLVTLLVLAAARPQLTQGEVQRSSEGLDIVLAIDTSGSMRALDFEIDGKRDDRLAVVKSVITKFISSRPDDRIGMVVFGQEAFTQAPLTLDHNVLMKFLERVQIGMAGDGTAIGDAIATSTTRVKDIKAKSRVVILLTDGKNTAGTVDPMLAAEAAASLGVKIYTIGVGKKGKVPFPVEGFFGSRLVYRESDLDEKLLQKVADATQAKFFRASDTQALIKVYDTIDKLEKTKIEVKEFTNYDEVYATFVWPAFVLLLLEVLFSLTRFWRLP